LGNAGFQIKTEKTAKYDQYRGCIFAYFLAVAPKKDEYM
jgi:hypothetical protein